MASYRLHCWVTHAEGLHFPKMGGWAPIVELKCGLGVAKSGAEDVVMFKKSGRGAPVFNYYLRIAVVSPLVNDVVVTVYNDKAIGKGKLGSILVPVKNLIRGIPIGFRKFPVIDRRGKTAGSVNMRIVLQYPETLTLRPNTKSRDQLMGFKHRGAPTLLLLGALRIEGIKASHGLKMNIVNFDTKIQALYPTADPDGTDIGDHFWVDLRNKTVDLTFKVKRLASWIKIGTCHINLQQFNSGDVVTEWQSILNKREIEIGRIRLSIQMQFYHSVLVPPECTTSLLKKHQAQIFATNAVFARVAEEEAVLAAKQKTAKAKPKGLPVAPISIQHKRSLPRSSSMPMTPSANQRQERVVRRVSSHHDIEKEELDDAEERAAREEQLALERAIELSAREYQRDQERALASARNSLIDVKPRAPPGPAPVSAFGAGAVAVSLDGGENPTLQRMPSTNPAYLDSGSAAAAATANAHPADHYTVEGLAPYSEEQEESGSDQSGDYDYGYRNYPARSGGAAAASAAASAPATVVMLQPSEMTKQGSWSSMTSQQSHGDVGREMFQEAMSNQERAAYYAAGDSDSDSDSEEQGGGEPIPPPPAQLPAAVVRLDTAEPPVPDPQGASPRTAAATQAAEAAAIAKAKMAARASLLREQSEYAHIRRDMIID